MTSPGTVIEMPPQQLIRLVAEEGLEHTETLVGGNPDPSAIAVMKVQDPTGKFVTREWRANFNAISNSFKWDIPFEDIDYVHHGSRYRIYIIYSNGRRKTLRYGLLVWIGR